MAWQDVFPVSSPRIDAEEDRELRLAAQAHAGADWALTALVARYQPPVTRYLTRLTGNADLARALAARVFIRMERRLHGPEGGRHLRLWLLRASTEAGLDALRKPQHARAALLASPKRPAGLLTDGTPATRVQRLRARIDALAQVALQTRRQVRKLVWAAMPDPEPAADLDADLDADAAHDARDPELMEALRRQDPREALRYRIVRAVLAELPYGDAQCLALHLVAGLNQAEVATALGLTNSATRRRIVQGLQLFSQRFNAAAASLGLAPDALAAHPTHPAAPLEPGVGGYVPVQEQPTVTISSPYAAAAGLVPAPANGHVPTPAPVPMDAATVVEAAPTAADSSDGELSPAAGVIPAEPVVDTAPFDVEEPPAAGLGVPMGDPTVVDALPVTEHADEAVRDDAGDADVEASASAVPLDSGAPLDAEPEVGHSETDATDISSFDAAEVIAAGPPAVVAAEAPEDGRAETAVADVAGTTVDAAADPAETATATADAPAGDVIESSAAEMPVTAATEAIVSAERPVDATTVPAEPQVADVPLDGPAEPADVTSHDAPTLAGAAEAEESTASAGAADVMDAAEATEVWDEPQAAALAANASVDTRDADAADVEVATAETGVATAKTGTIPAGRAVIEPRVVPVLTPRVGATPVSVPVRVVPVLTPVTPVATVADDEPGDPAGEADQTEHGDD